jgi:hypothetical protein
VLIFIEATAALDPNPGSFGNKRSFINAMSAVSMAVVGSGSAHVMPSVATAIAGTPVTRPPITPTCL